MGQEEVYNYIKKAGTWVTTEELNSALESGYQSILVSLKKLYNSGYLERIEDYRRLNIKEKNKKGYLKAFKIYKFKVKV